MGIGDWGLGIGDWAQSPIPNPQSPIPKTNKNFIIIYLLKKIIFNLFIKLINKIIMGNEISQFCECKEIKDIFNPDLEDVNKYLFIIF